MKKSVHFLSGFIAAILVILLIDTALASGSVLPGTSATINVKFSTLKTIINGKEFMPAGDDMIPFLYNDRTFVSLKFIAEAFGKDIYWDREGNAAVINDPVPYSNVYRDPLTSIPLSRDWSKSGTVNPDIENGVLIDGRASLSLTQYHNRNARNYTVEFDWAQEYTTLLSYGTDVVISRMRNGNAMDKIYLSRAYLSINGEGNNYPSGLRLERDKFYRVRIEVRDGMIDVYIDGVYIASGGYKGEEVSIRFGPSHYLYGAYIRNFQLTLND